MLWCVPKTSDVVEAADLCTLGVFLTSCADDRCSDYSVAKMVCRVSVSQHRVFNLKTKGNVPALRVSFWGSMVLVIVRYAACIPATRPFVLKRNKIFACSKAVVAKNYYDSVMC